MGARAVRLLVLGASLLLPAARAAAQAQEDATRAEARKIGYAGVEAYQAGDFATARDRLETAYRLLQVPSLGLWSARALAKVGKLVEAEVRYLEVIRLPTSVGDEAIQTQARQDARSERAALAERIPGILVRVEGAAGGEVAVTIDGAPLAGSAVGENHPVNPGRHEVEGIRGTARARAEVVLAEGEQKAAVLRFAPAPTDASSAGAPAAVGVRDGSAATGDGSMHTIGWVALSAGGAGLAVGAVTGLLAMSKKSDLDKNGCSGGSNCPEDQRGNVDSYNNLRVVSGVSLIAGAVLAGAGAYLVLTTPSPGPPGEPTASARRRRSTIANLRFGVVPGGTIVSGEF